MNGQDTKLDPNTCFVTGRGKPAAGYAQDDHGPASCAMDCAPRTAQDRTKVEIKSVRKCDAKVAELLANGRPRPKKERRNNVQFNQT